MILLVEDVRVSEGKTDGRLPVEPGTKEGVHKRSPRKASCCDPLSGRKQARAKRSETGSYGNFYHSMPVIISPELGKRKQPTRIILRRYCGPPAASSALLRLSFASAVPPAATPPPCREVSRDVPPAGGSPGGRRLCNLHGNNFGSRILVPIAVSICRKTA